MKEGIYVDEFSKDSSYLTRSRYVESLDERKTDCGRAKVLLQVRSDENSCICNASQP